MFGEYYTISIFPAWPNKTELNWKSVLVKDRLNISHKQQACKFTPFTYSLKCVSLIACFRLE